MPMSVAQAQQLVANYRGEYKGVRDGVQWYWVAQQGTYLGVVPVKGAQGQVEVKMLPRKSCGC